MLDLEAERAKLNDWRIRQARLYLKVARGLPDPLKRRHLLDRAIDLLDSVRQSLETHPCTAPSR